MCYWQHSGALLAFFQNNSLKDLISSEMSTLGPRGLVVAQHVVGARLMRVNHPSPTTNAYTIVHTLYQNTSKDYLVY